MPIDREDVKLLVGVLEDLCGGRVRLAAAARVSQSTLWRYGEGDVAPPPATLERLVAAAGVPMWAIDLVLLPALGLVLRLSRAKAAPAAAAVAERLAAVQEELDEALAAAGRIAVAGFLAGEGANDEAAAAPAPDAEHGLLVDAQAGAAAAPPLLGKLRRELESFCARLCAESARAAAHAAAQALQLAQLALRIAQLVPAEVPEGSRLLGYVWAFVANAQRVRGDLAAAEASFGAAWGLWRAGAGDASSVLCEWRLLDLEASLRRDRRQFSAALDLLDRAIALAPAEACGRILLKRATTLEQAGEVAAALAALRDAAPLVEAAGEPRDRWVLGFNLLVNLCHLGHYEEAAASLPALAALTRELDNGLDQLRVGWFGGRVAAGRGRRAEARAAFEEALRGFAAVGDGYDAALVGLELAALHLDAGRTAEVRALAAEMLRIFRAQEVHREAAAALALFCQAAEREAATASLARQVLAYLERARRDPELRFEEAQVEAVLAAHRSRGRPAPTLRGSGGHRR
ncbi:MAG TPA: hypothetical protein VJA16_11700 [Thermoanaerobaculia bacterium]